jgi:hypothetical protein
VQTDDLKVFDDQNVGQEFEILRALRLSGPESDQPSLDPCGADR